MEEVSIQNIVSLIKAAAGDKNPGDNIELNPAPDKSVLIY